MVLEDFSGIPVKALLENDEKTTKLDLSNSGCGVTEACVLAECLKVFFFFSRVFLEYSSVLPLPPSNTTVLP